jgi:glycosyltransferase involved in cell wall biosynthesis
MNMEKGQGAKRTRVLSTFRVVTPPLSEHATYLYDLLPEALRDILRRTSFGQMIEGIFALILSRRFDATITVGTNVTFAYGLVNRLFCLRRCQVAKELYFDETSLASPFKRRLMRWALRRVGVIISNSQGEIPYMMDLLGLSREQFEFIPWATTFEIPEQPEKGTEYIFAGGRSFRDWVTLFEAVAGTGLRTVVVAAAIDVVSESVPQEVELLVDIPYAEYVKLLRSARIVVVPVAPTFRSVGQIALLDAMALGKPVIATRALGIVDYVENRVSGLLYESGQAANLKEMLLMLYQDEALQESLGRAAQQQVREKFNSSTYSRVMARVIDRLCIR